MRLLLASPQPSPLHMIGPQEEGGAHSAPHTTLDDTDARVLKK